MLKKEISVVNKVPSDEHVLFRQACANEESSELPNEVDVAITKRME